MNDKFHMTLEENLFLARKILVETIYNTAKLEGVNTTFPETEAILDGVNVPGAKLDDIQVILNLRDAWREVLANLPIADIDLSFIKKINTSVSRNESLAWGELRTGPIGISGTNHKPKIPNEDEASAAIEAILHDASISATEQAIDVALYIMHEQLFWDGNKRTANVAANAVLIQNGAGVLSISTDNIAEFNRLLKYYYDTNDGQGLKEFLYTTAVIDFASKNVPVNDPVNVPLNSTEQAVLEVITKDPFATYDDIAGVIGKTRKTVSRTLANLKQRGMLERKGSDKSGSWAIVDEGR